MIYDLFLHFKYTKILKKIYKSENILQNLTNLFGFEFKKDWVGRIYAVLNPYIKDGKFDPTATTIEYSEYGTHDEAYVKAWIMERLLVVDKFIKVNNLFDILTYEIKPLEKGNHLFIIKPITFDDFVKSLKKLSILLSVLVLTGVAFYVYNYIV